MTTPARPVPPEATLIRLAREAAGISPETAAARMRVKFSGTRWRQIEAAYRKDSDTLVKAKAPTLAQMAHAVDVSADRLAAAGREDAAEILREIEAAGDTPEPTSQQTALTDLQPWQRDVILRALDEKPRSKQEKALLLRRLAEQIEQQPNADDESDLPTLVEPKAVSDSE